MSVNGRNHTFEGIHHHSRRNPSHTSEGRSVGACRRLSRGPMHELVSPDGSLYRVAEGDITDFCEQHRLDRPDNVGRLREDSCVYRFSENWQSLNKMRWLKFVNKKSLLLLMIWSEYQGGNRADTAAGAPQPAFGTVKPLISPSSPLLPPACLSAPRQPTFSLLAARPLRCLPAPELGADEWSSPSLVLPRSCRCHTVHTVSGACGGPYHRVHHPQ